jgi:hypothetical protein
VHMHSSLRSLRQGQVHVGPITWEVLPQLTADEEEDIYVPLAAARGLLDAG